MKQRALKKHEIRIKLEKEIKERKMNKKNNASEK